MNVAEHDLISYLYRLQIASMEAGDSRWLVQQLEAAGVLVPTLVAAAPAHYAKIAARMLWQRQLNTVIAQEIVQLSQHAEQHSLKLVHLKGLTLAEALYTPREARMFKDIDLLVDVCDLEGMLVILGETGFVDQYGEPVGRRLVGNLAEFHTIHHLHRVSKRVTLDVVAYDIVVELHINLFQRPWQRSTIDTRALVERATIETFDGQPMWLLELHDQLAHLLYHASVHYIYSYLKFFAYGEPIEPGLARLHDIALLIDSRAQSIVWSTLYERTVALDITHEVLFGLRLLSAIYPHRVPDAMLTVVLTPPDATAAFETRALAVLAQEDPAALLSGSFDQILARLIAALRCDEPILLCAWKQATAEASNSFVIDEYASHIPNRQGTHAQRMIDRDSVIQLRASGHIWWDAHALHIFIDVQDAGMTDIVTSGRQRLHDIEVMIDQGVYRSQNPLLRRAVFQVAREGSHLAVIVRNGATDALLPDRHVHWSPHAVRADGYTLVLSLAWEAMEVRPAPGRRFGFDLALRGYEPSCQSIAIRLVWSNSVGSWRDPTAYGVVELCGGEADVYDPVVAANEPGIVPVDTPHTSGQEPPVVGEPLSIAGFLPQQRRKRQSAANDASSAPEMSLPVGESDVIERHPAAVAGSWGEMCVVLNLESGAYYVLTGLQRECWCALDTGPITLHVLFQRLGHVVTMPELRAIVTAFRYQRLIVVQ